MKETSIGSRQDQELELDGHDVFDELIRIDEMLDHICTDHQICGSRLRNREVTGFPVPVGVSLLKLREILRQFQAGGLVVSEMMNQLVARSAADVENLSELVAFHQLESVKVYLQLPFIGEI